MTVARLETEADSWELSHWFALQYIDGPVKTWKTDYDSAAMVSSWVAASAGSPVEPEKLVPIFDRNVQDKYEDAKVEAERLQKAQRQLTGGN